MSDTDLAVEPAIAENPTDVAALNKATDQEDAAPAPAKVEAPEDKIQKRFDKLTKEKYEAFRERDRLAYEIEQIKVRLDAKTTQPATEAPTLESAGFDETKYQKELLEFARLQARDEAKKALAEERANSKATEQNATFESRQEEFIKSNPEYIEKVLERDKLPISSEIQDALKQMENGPRIALYLCSNEDKALQIMRLPPLLQAREIGRIEASFENKPAPPVVSKAPPPPAKLDAAASTTVKDLTDPTLTDKQFREIRRRQIAQRR